jgi:hypothetical protein
MALDRLFPHQPDAVWRHLDIALSTAASLQASIRHADTKAATLLSIQGGVATIAVDQASPLFAGSGRPMVAAVIVVIILSGSLGVGAWHLAMAVIPRLTGPAGPNRFAFPVTRSGHRPTLNVQDQCDEAWDLVAVLGATAMAKHHRVRRSWPWLATATVSAGVLVVLKIFLGAVA